MTRCRDFTRRHLIDASCLFLAFSNACALADFYFIIYPLCGARHVRAASARLALPCYDVDNLQKNVGHGRRTGSTLLTTMLLKLPTVSTTRQARRAALRATTRRRRASRRGTAEARSRADRLTRHAAHLKFI